jgi:uncharacterized membrane protein
VTLLLLLLMQKRLQALIKKSMSVTENSAKTVNESSLVPDTLEAEIERQIGPLVNSGQRNEIVSRVVKIAAGERFSGPIAHPRHLREYEQILPGAAERIVRMAEKAQEHNSKMDELIVKQQIEDQKRGMNYGFVALLVLIGCAAYFGYAGNPIVSGLFLTAAALNTVSGFIKGRQSK